MNSCTIALKFDVSVVRTVVGARLVALVRFLVLRCAVARAPLSWPGRIEPWLSSGAAGLELLTELDNLFKLNDEESRGRFPRSVELGFEFG